MTKTSLKDKAYDELRKRILCGDLPPGEFLTERSLEQLLEMSRTPIRGALQRLEAEGLVNYTPNRGLAVAELSIHRAVDVYDFRVALEAHVARKLSSRVWEDEEILAVQDILVRQHDSLLKNDYHQFTVDDWKFHQMLTQVYGNKEMIQSMERIQDSLYQIATRVLRKDPKRIQVSYDDHVRIFDSILSGDPEKTVKIVVDHLEFGKQILIM